MHRVGSIVVAVALVCCVGTDACAQDVSVLYGIRSYQGLERIPVYPPYHYRVAPRAEPAGLAPRIIEITPGAPPSGAVAATRLPVRGNPLAALLSDATLRPGDVVMFAEGARIFSGPTYGRRDLADFVPVAAGARMLPPAVRDHVLRLRPGWSDTWAGVAPSAAVVGERPTRGRPSGFEVVRVSAP